MKTIVVTWRNHQIHGRYIHQMESAHLSRLVAYTCCLFCKIPGYPSGGKSNLEDIYHPQQNADECLGEKIRIADQRRSWIQRYKFCSTKPSQKYFGFTASSSKFFKTNGSLEKRKVTTLTHNTLAQTRISSGTQNETFSAGAGKSEWTEKPSPRMKCVRDGLQAEWEMTRRIHGWLEILQVTRDRSPKAFTS